MGQVPLRGIRKSCGDLPVIQGVDLDVRDCEFLGCVGPSGCGKRTTLRMIGRLENITAGDLLNAMVGAGHAGLDNGTAVGLQPDTDRALAFSAAGSLLP